MGELLDYEKLRIAKDPDTEGWKCIEPENPALVPPNPEKLLSYYRSECLAALAEAKRQCDIAAELSNKIAELEWRI